MRLMLGTAERPSLLVDVDEDYDPTHFKFYVINGGWEGTFYNGYVTVHHPWNPHSSLDKVEILTDNQDRLRCGQRGSSNDYNDVFENFDNPDYVAPLYTYNREFLEDDDIPF